MEVHPFLSADKQTNVILVRDPIEEKHCIFNPPSSKHTFPNCLTCSLQELRETRQQCVTLREQLQTLLLTAATVQDDTETEEKLKSAEAEKQALVEQQAKMKEEFEKWKEQFKEEHEGEEPTEDDR